MFSWYKCLIVSLLFFSHLGFWSGSLFLVAPFPDLCLLVLSSREIHIMTFLQECYSCQIRFRSNFLDKQDVLDFLFRRMHQTLGCILRNKIYQHQNKDKQSIMKRQTKTSIVNVRINLSGRQSAVALTHINGDTL